MAKDILIYGDIHSYSAAEFIHAVDELEEGEPLSVRINTVGGDPQSSFGMISKIQEFEGEKIVRVDGQAYSTGFFICCFADRVEALDVSRFLIHRGSFGEYTEQSSSFADSGLKSELEAINKLLETAFRKKVDIKKFEAISGVKVKDIFSLDQRLNVFLTAKEAKQIGLVQTITKITPSMRAQFSAWNEQPQIAAVHYDDKEPIRSENKNQNIMTLEEFKKANPEAISAMNKEQFNAGHKAGIEAEQKRVADWTEHISADAEMVKAGIESGDVLGREELTTLIKKSVVADSAANLEAEGAATVDATSTAPVVDTKDERTDAQKEIDAFSGKVDAKLGIEKKA